MRSGACAELETLVLPTDAIACSYLPTPTASSYGSNRGGAAGRTGKVRLSLQSMARTGLWPTPRAQDGKHGRASDYELARDVNKDLLHVRIARHGDRGPLNPMWVEWLMGFPLGWTALPASAMPSSPRSRKKSAASSSPPTAS